MPTETKLTPGTRLRKDALRLATRLREVALNAGEDTSQLDRALRKAEAGDDDEAMAACRSMQNQKLATA